MRTTGAVALMPLLTLPPNDPTVAVRDVREAVIRRRLLSWPQLYKCFKIIRDAVGGGGRKGLAATE